MGDDLLKAKLKETVYAVAANDYERFALWRENAQDSGSPLIAHPVDWQQDSEGYLFQVGELADMPVTISLSWAMVNGHRVLFYDSPSLVTDQRMIEKWLDENCNPMEGDGAQARCNAMNFHLCLHSIEARARRGGASTGA
ncbi:MAG TPA: hypothetical protein VJS44_08125 [Pyrinomonadaceae bacterium]|nr:hypothetical protein [Pyrinomonadaceae bacterium]